MLEILALAALAGVAFIVVEAKFRRLPEADRSPKIFWVRGVAVCCLTITMAMAIFVYRVETKRRGAEDQMARLEADAKAHSQREERKTKN